MPILWFHVSLHTFDFIGILQKLTWSWRRGGGANRTLSRIDKPKQKYCICFKQSVQWSHFCKKKQTWPPPRHKILKIIFFLGHLLTLDWGCFPWSPSFSRTFDLMIILISFSTLKLHITFYKEPNNIISR